MVVIMSVQVIQRTFATGPQTGLAIRNDEYLRLLPVGNNWKWLRIGISMAIDSTEPSIYLAMLSVGVCTYPYGLWSWNCPNYVGNVFGSTDGSIATTYVAGSAPYYNTYINCGAYRSSGGSIFHTNALSSFYLASTAGLPRRSIFCVDIVKGSPNYTLSGYGSVSAAQVQLDWTAANLMEICAQTGSPYVGATSMTAGLTGTTPPVSETNGPLNAVSVAWNKLECAAEIYGIAVFMVN